jgi:pyruvate kinase
VFDGTDAVMLSGRDRDRLDPVNVVRTMARICERGRAGDRIDGWRDPLPSRAIATG